MTALRELAKNLAARLPGHLVETAANYAALGATPGLLPTDHVTGDRRAYFTQVSDRLGGPATQLTFLEFGVHRGDSLRQWTALNAHPDSRFIGFDSFTGLPTRWRGRPAGYFDTGGQPPAIGDPRVRFVKGWFNQSLPAALDDLGDEHGTLLVHIDADLHSAALYCLITLGLRLGAFHVMFDEFGAGEGRALRDVIEAFGVAFTPALGLKRQPYSTLPTRVFGHIAFPTPATSPSRLSGQAFDASAPAVAQAAE